jgi:RNA polymerase sigma factor (sigma-70 family)
VEQGGLNICIDDIVNNYGPMVSSICRRMIKNEEDAKDAAQEAWTEILKGLPKFRGDAKISTWIYAITYHTVMRYTQKERAYTIRFLRNYFHGEQREVPCDIDYDRNIWIKEMCDKCLTGILHCLDGEGRMAYIFRDMAQLSYEDIATVLEKDPAAVRQIVSRCRRKLKSFLNDECALYNPEGKCRCRMNSLVKDIQLSEEYMKLRRFVSRANVYLESRYILPQKNYWENLI